MASNLPKDRTDEMTTGMRKVFKHFHFCISEVSDGRSG
ncbi:unnamed protein product [Brugia timori]|uniref:Globin n=1 Tax=Brugia timori TaxID=42155 RepID=A0A0R3QS65_9BILA|nr:unnamed protein product [Brugia timori]